MKDIEHGLTEGLSRGYAGGKPEFVLRGGFVGKGNVILGEDLYYHDEWFVDTHIGGGQELLEINGRKFTRLYAGGTPERESLERLNISEDDVSKYLKDKILELGSGTRLFDDCLPGADGEWLYQYKVTSKDELIGVTTGMETIEYQGERVHLHAFILSPVE